MKNLSFLCLAAAFFTGCVRVAKEPVYIPVKCEISAPNMPPSGEGKALSERVLDLVVYAEKLEHSLKFCTGKE